MHSPEREVIDLERNSIARILTGIVLLTSIAVMAGWLLGTGVLKSILPDQVIMKFITAICSALTSWMMYSIISSAEVERDAGIEGTDSSAEGLTIR
ncbi:MAG TPA: hypothetical protein VJI75_00190 [Candidatus Nanoarchaeia archaeon]|nr:hypothetical protein [Candidatus Nanoarchaeia archaeon]